MFRRCPPGCARASGLLLTPPRAMRCEPAVRQHDCFFPPNRCYAHHLGTVALAMPGLLTSPITTATLPPPLRHTNSLPAQRPPPASASRLFSGIPPREMLCRCVAPVLLLFLHHSAAARVPAKPLSSADLAVADSPLFARRHPAAVSRRGRPPVGGPVPSTPVRTCRC